MTNDHICSITVAITRYTDRYHQDQAAKRPKLDTIKSSKRASDMDASEKSSLDEHQCVPKSHSGYILDLTAAEIYCWH